jgi:hypothetical protein
MLGFKLYIKYNETDVQKSRVFARLKSHVSNLITDFLVFPAHAQWPQKEL